jgi:hypothetical protein
MALNDADKQYIRALVAKAVRAAVAEAKAEICATLRKPPSAREVQDTRDRLTYAVANYHSRRNT